MDKKAFQLLSRYSLPPNSLGYCGKGSAPEKFKNCIKNGVCDGLDDEVSHFIVLNPYLETLKEITGRDKFAYENIEAYWLGNDELNKAEPEHYNLLLKNFEKQGVPEWLLDELRNTPPKKFVPSHLFQVLHVGVGRSSGSVPFNLESINNCMIRWGKVSKIIDNLATVELNTLKELDNGYELVINLETHEFSKEITPSIKIGDVATVHWKMVTNVLNKQEIEKIEFWTNKVLRELCKD